MTLSVLSDFFQVASSRDRYRLSVGNYRANAGEEGLVLVLSLHREANAGTCVFVLPVEWELLGSGWIRCGSLEEKSLSRETESASMGLSHAEDRRKSCLFMGKRGSVTQGKS